MEFYQALLEKFLYATVTGFIIGFIRKWLRVRLMIKKKNKFIQYKRDLKIRLKPQINYSKNEIIEFGRKALRCNLAKDEMMTNPVISVDGYSYERANILNYIKTNKSLPNSNINDSQEKLVEMLYENRILKEILEIYKKHYNLS